MSNDLTDAVARAIFDAPVGNPRIAGYDELREKGLAYYRGQADAAIAAVIEALATEAQLDGLSVHEDTGSPLCSAYLTDLQGWLRSHIATGDGENQ